MAAYTKMECSLGAIREIAPAQTRACRVRLAPKKSRPTRQPNSIRAPRLSSRPSRGAPLKNGEKILSVGIT